MVRGPFKCYVTQYGGGRVLDVPEKQRYEDLRFNVIRVTRGWVGVEFLENKRYVTLEWPLRGRFMLPDYYCSVLSYCRWSSTGPRASD